MVNQQTLQGNWNELKGMLRTKWGQLTNDDVQTFDGNVDRLVGMIQRKTGEARSAIESYLDEITADGSSTVAQAVGAARDYAQQAAGQIKETSKQAAESMQQGYEEAERMVKERNIRNAVILSAIGSVRNYHVHSVSNREFPSKNLFITNTQRPADIVSMNGYVIDGRVHAHLTMTDEHGAFGGHLGPDTNVFTFAVVTLGVFADGVDLSKVEDKTYR